VSATHRDEAASLHPEVRETAGRIGDVEVRSAAAIADAAALCAQAADSDADTAEALRAELRAAARRLHDTRPTAVSCRTPSGACWSA